MSYLESDDQYSLSDVQSQLQGLVTVKIKDSDKATHEKRVRFNSLVEVRFIPKIKAKKEKNKEDREQKKSEEKENSATEAKEINVANGNEAAATQVEGTNEPTKTDSTPEKRKIKEKTNIKPSHSENKDDEESKGSQVATREGFSLSKVTIGQEYDGVATRTPKVIPKPQPKNSICRMLKRGGKESRIYELNAKAVVHLERQASELCKEVDRLFEKAVPIERSVWSSPLSTSKRENVETYRFSPSDSRKDDQELPPAEVLRRSKSIPELRIPSLREMTEKSDLERGGKNTKKLSTSLPYINMIPSLIGKTQDTIQKDSYTKLYLPQLQRKAEEIKRLNETILRKKPKYSRPDKSPSSPSDSISPLGFTGDRNCEKNGSPPASSHSIVRYSHGLDIARLLNSANPAHLFY